MTRQVVWEIFADVKCSSANTGLGVDRPLFAVSVKSRKCYVVLIYDPESATPIMSIKLKTKVVAMTWGRESAQEGKQLCLFCLTKKGEIIELVEGEPKKVENKELMKPTAFDEVFEVDKVASLSKNMMQTENYRKDEMEQ